VLNNGGSTEEQLKIFIIILLDYMKQFLLKYLHERKDLIKVFKNLFKNLKI